MHLRTRLGLGLGLSHFSGMENGELQISGPSFHLIDGELKNLESGIPDFYSIFKFFLPLFEMSIRGQYCTI